MLRPCEEAHASTSDQVNPVGGYGPSWGGGTAGLTADSSLTLIVSPHSPEGGALDGKPGLQFFHASGQVLRFDGTQHEAGEKAYDAASLCGGKTQVAPKVLHLFIQKPEHVLCGPKLQALQVRQLAGLTG